MTSSLSPPTLNEQGRPIHRYNISPSPQPRGEHYANMRQGIQTAFLGPMPPKQFISEFLPLGVAEEEVSSAFEEGFFDEVIKLYKDKEGRRKEEKLYDPFCLKIRTIIPNLIICNISSRPDNTSYDYCFSIKPDCGVYRKEDEGKEVTRANPALVEFFVEFKWSRDDDPFQRPERSHDESLSIPLNESSSACNTIGQIGTYIALQMDSQYRTHAFFVLIVGDYARLMRWDRGGVIFTDPIYYNKQSELVEFFERYNTAPPEVRGSDKSVGQPFPEESDAASSFGISNGYSEFSARPLLAVSFDSNDLGHLNRYIIPSPFARPSLPIGRSTRTSIAYDVQRHKLVMMKDSWPVFVHDDIMEGRVYQQLHAGNVWNTPICVDFSNSGDNSNTRTQHFIHESWRLENLAFSLPLRRHHRLILDTVGKSLDKFTSSKELVRAVRAAMIAHQEAYLLGFLHRDISSGNILITDDKRYDGGLLIDWDLCKSKDIQETHRPQGSRTGTWRFLAAELIDDPRIPHSFVHDLESYYFVLLSHGICNMNHTFSAEQAGNIIYDILDSRRYNSGGGLQKSLFLDSFRVIHRYNSPSNKPFTTLLYELHRKHNARYRLLTSTNDLSVEEIANIRSPSFVAPEVYMAHDFRHEVFIAIIDNALNSEGWPEGDHAIHQQIIRSNSSAARSASSSKRSRTWSENGNQASLGGRSKRLNLGST